jgi:hypothetical protein
MATEYDRILHRHNCPGAEPTRQHAGEGIDTPSMAASDRAHLIDFPIEQLHSIILGKNARFSHAVVCRYVKQVLGHLSLHASHLSNRSGS